MFRKLCDMIGCKTEIGEADLGYYIFKRKDLWLYFKNYFPHHLRPIAAHSGYYIVAVPWICSAIFSKNLSNYNTHEKRTKSLVSGMLTPCII